ncbi:hypothetical protein [Bacillus sp. 1P02SD]|uniref:hypothetical protein n=1 Tax=Bacillus sp. 1P02SD TaxID=3132264 RepID=UPI0039A161EF
MNKTRYSKIWNLDNLYQDGSIQLNNHIKQIEIRMAELEEKLNSLGNLSEVNSSLRIESIVKHMADIRFHLSQVNSYTSCLLAQNPKDQNAMTVRGFTSSNNARFESAINTFQSVLLSIDQKLWEVIVETKALKNYKFILNEWRKKAKISLSEEEEGLISALMVDGYHAWGQFYQSVIGSIKVGIQIEEEHKDLSVGQAINLRSYPNKNIRKTAHHVLEDIWKEKEELFS